MHNTKKNLILLTILFAVLMSLPYIVPGLGFLALVGFIPLLMMDLIADINKVKKFWIWHYSAFVLWNAITTFWVCNATIGGGLFAIFANALQMSLIFGTFRFSKKYLGNILSYILLAAMWIAWEKFYFNAEISWPWLVLGNAFAGDIKLIQWYEFTGSLGGSLWIWLSNIFLFFILINSLGDNLKNIGWKGTVALYGSFIIIIACPIILSHLIYENYEEESKGKVEVVIAQPNFDPYQKFESLSQRQQNSILMDLMRKGLSDYDSTSNNALLLLAPETFTGDIALNDIKESTTWQSFNAFLQDFPRANLLFGASTTEFIYNDEAPSNTARKLRDSIWYQTYNSALMTDYSGRTDIFHKSKLVVGVEKTPYPAVFTKIDDMLGGVMGRNIGQEEISLLNINNYNDEGKITSRIPVGCAICYESVYGDYCRDYVKKGARAMTIITNDSWWGNTPGYRQHFRYARLRAIELRRDIARCGNSGISAFINQRGDVVQKSEWWQREFLKGEISLNDKQTFFVRYGDVVGRICSFVFMLLVLLLFVRAIIRR